MEMEFTNTYEKLMQQDESFQIEKSFLSSLVNEKNIKSKEAYKELNKIGGLPGLLDRLEVNTTSGICEEEEDPDRFNQRKKQFGINAPVSPLTRSFFKCLLDVFYDKILIFLIFTATLRLIMDLIEGRDKWFDFCSIYIIVIIFSIIVAITNYSRDKVFANFQMKIEHKQVRVLRNKIEKLIPIHEIVVGDILIVSAGDILPTDGVIFKAYSVSIETDNKVMKFHNIYFRDNKGICKHSRLNQIFDQLSMPVDEFYPLVLSGSKILKGYAYLLVLSVGCDTFINRKYIDSMKNQTVFTKLPEQKGFETNEQTATGELYLVERTKSKQNEEINMRVNINEENGLLNENRDKIGSGQGKELKKMKKSDDNDEEREKEILNVNEKDKSNKNIVKQEHKLSPLQTKLEEISCILSKFGIAASIVSVSFIILTYFVSPNHFSPGTDFFRVMLDAILYGLVIIVVAVPEGLPLAATLSLAFSLNKMRDEKTVIKSIEACENMACVDTICTDYRGILTKSEMQIISIFIEEQHINESNVVNLKDFASEDLYNFFCESISVNSIAFSVQNIETGKEDYVGDPIECSLLRFVRNKLHVDYLFIRNNTLRPIVDISPYTPDQKCSYTAIEMDEKKDYVRLYVKGSPDYILDLISFYIGSGQILEQITPTRYEKIRRRSNTLIKEGNIPMIICYRDIPKDHYYQTRRAYFNKEDEFMVNIVRQLTFICLIGLRENFKEGVEQDILNCQNAGIVVRLVTSQSKESAKIAAVKCGIIAPERDGVLRYSTNMSNKIKIYQEEGSSIKEKSNSILSVVSLTDKPLILNSRSNQYEIIDTREDFRKFVDTSNNKKNYSSFKSFEFSIPDFNKFSNILDNARVISGASSKDKFILVSTLKKKGSIVAITGDGVNDFLAMRTAHVGISVGNNYSDISKKAADVILLEDDFKGIITGIIFSRNIFDSVRKFLQFQITATASICILVVISSIPYINFYLYPNQLLWLNLIIDTFGSLSLASGQPDRNTLLKKKNYSLQQNIITKTMKIKIIVQTSIQLAILLFLVYMVPLLFDLESNVGIEWNDYSMKTNGYHTTFIFTCIVFMQVFNAIISRSIDKNDMNILRNIHNHGYFIIIQSGIIVLQYFIVANGESILKTSPLGLNSFLMCIGIASITLLTLPILYYLPYKDDTYEEEISRE